MSLASLRPRLHTAAAVPQPPDAAIPVGEETAAIEFAAFFRAEFAAVTRTAYLILRDHDAAEDIAQDAFTQLHRHWTKVSAYEKPGAWVRRVAIRLAVRSVRRRQILGSLLGRLDPPASQPPSRDPDLAAALAQLPPKQRAAVALYYYEDRPVDEVAAILGCAPNTAKVHLFKARKRLAALLDLDPGEGTDVA